jgi:uncharacterized protein (TIGR03435 family)
MAVMRVVSGWLLATVIGALAPAVGHAQPPAATSVEVASVRSKRSGGTADTIRSMPTGRLVATNATLRALILRAYGLHASQLIDSPAWIETERFDIDARAAEPPALGPEALMPMVRSLLEDRFKLRTRRETRARPAYLLDFARRERRLGPQIRPTIADCSRATTMTGAEMRASVRDGWPPCGLVFVVSFTTKTAAGVAVELRTRRSGTTMGELATALQGAVDRPVVDRTGLEGRYDVEYTHAPQPPDPNVESAFRLDAPRLFVALQEQLGLTLRAERAEVTVLVIEAVDRPSEN